MVRNIWNKHKWWLVLIAIVLYAAIFYIADAVTQPTPAKAATLKDMRRLHDLVVQHAGHEADEMSIAIGHEGYAYHIAYSKNDHRQKLVIQRKGDMINDLAFGPDGRMVLQSVVITTTFVDEGADGFLDDMHEEASKSRYWIDLNKMKGHEQEEYDKVLRTLLFVLAKTAPI